MTYVDTKLETRELQAAKLAGFIQGLELVLDRLEMDYFDHFSEIRDQAAAELKELQAVVYKAQGKEPTLEQEIEKAMTEAAAILNKVAERAKEEGENDWWLYISDIREQIEKAHNY